jgi:hypothetical protein
VSAIGRRCSMGCETWPDTDEYSLCPICDNDTKRFRGVEPLLDQVALSKKCHAEFQRYYKNQHIADTKPYTDAELSDMGIVLKHRPVKI